MYNIAVVMSTYNGGKYFTEQLQSILRQKGVKVYLYIRDDGSTDQLFIGQLRKLNEIPNIDVYLGANLGVGPSFFECLKRVPDTYDYYAFSDQDDVWLEDKLLQAICKLEQLEGKALYASNQYVVDENLNNRHLRFLQCPDIRYGDIIRGNKISGCTFVFNRSLFCFLVDEMNCPGAELLKVRIHDVWVAEVAALFGQIFYDENAYILYRQHGSNVVGAQEYSFFKRLSTKLSYLAKAQVSAPFLCKELCKIFSKRLGAYYEPICCFALYQDCLAKQIKLLRYYSCFKHINESLMTFFIKAILKIL